MGNSAQNFEFSDWHLQRPHAARSFFISLTVHVALAATAWNVNPHPMARPFPEPQLADLSDLQDRRIVWYAPQQELPQVAPQEQPAPQLDQAEEARFELPQGIAANDPDPQSLRQMVLTDRPDIELTHDVALPNIVSWKPPEVERPRFQPTETQLTAPSTAGLPALEAPQLEPVVAADLSLAELQERTRLRFQQQQAERQTPQERALEVQELALELQAQGSSLDISELQELARLRYQAEQRTAANPRQQALPGEAAPDIRAQGTASLEVSELQQIARLRYQANGNNTPQAAPQRRAVVADNSPALTDASVSGGVALDDVLSQELVRLRYQSGQGGAPQDAPQRRALAESAGGQPGELEQLARASGGSTLDPAELQQIARLRYQETAGGAAGSGRNAPAARALGEAAGEGAPALSGGVSAAGLPGELSPTIAPPASLGAEGNQSGGTGGEIDLVAIGINPTDRLPEDLPSGSLRGEFTASPNTGEGRGATGTGAPVTVPNLAIDGPRTANSQPAQKGADLLASLTQHSSIRDAEFTAPSSDIVYNEKPIDLDNPFVGQPVYTLAVNLPNITSYRGDWVLQFAELVEAKKNESRDELEQRLAALDADLTPPFPVVKVDPKYVASAVREQVQGIVVIYGVIGADGILSRIRLVRGVDDRLDFAAQNALLQWEFEPARKAGKPISVETLIRIPFRLDPAVKMRY